MSTLHEKIMNIPCVVNGEHAMAYKLGHRDARHAAAAMALAAMAKAAEGAEPVDANGMVDESGTNNITWAHCYNNLIDKGWKINAESFQLGWEFALKMEGDF